MVGADLAISLADFSIAATFLNSSPKEVPKRRWSAGMVSATFLATKLRAGRICALLDTERR